MPLKLTNDQTFNHQSRWAYRLSGARPRASRFETNFPTKNSESWHAITQSSLKVTFYDVINVLRYLSALTSGLSSASWKKTSKICELCLTKIWKYDAMGTLCILPGVYRVRKLNIHLWTAWQPLNMFIQTHSLKYNSFLSIFKTFLINWTGESILQDAVQNDAIFLIIIYIID